MWSPRDRMHLEVWHTKGFRLDRRGKGLGLVERSGKATCSVNIAQANIVRGKEHERYRSL